jgi:hypothetical protein
MQLVSGCHSIWNSVSTLYVVVCVCVCVYIYIVRERLDYGLDDRSSVFGRAAMSIVYAVACRTAVGSTFPAPLALRLGRLGVELTARLRPVPGMGACPLSALLHGALFN